MNNQTEVSIKFKNSITKEKALEKYAQTLSRIGTVLKSIDKGSISQIEQSSQAIKEIDKNINSSNKNADKLGKKLNTAFDATLIIKFANSLGNAYKSLIKFTDASMSYVEALNLYQVAFEGDTKEADKFINKLSEMYGLDESWLTNTVSMFKQLSNAMGLSADTGKKLSNALTQLSIDTSSLYNINPEEAVSKFSSALAGQTKPVRSLGADITQSTLQETLTGLGIDKAVANLTYAEKRLTIVISLMQQLSKVTNDWGKTIESPANQTRILSEQWQRLTRAVGNVFLPLLTKILPYLNAILMVLTEIINTVAALFGFKLEDFDYGIGASADIIDDFADGLDNATGSSEKLKNSLKGLRSFDKLNVIKTPSADTSSAGIGGGGTGISPEILGAFDKTYADYMSKLKNVQMKATKIRDKIMEWLGFTKQIDSETGDVSFKFDHITGGTVLGALAVGGIIFKGISTIYKVLKKIGILDFPLLVKLKETIPKIATSIKTLTTKGGLTAALSSAKASLSKILPILGKFSVALAGIVTVVLGTKGVYNSMKKMTLGTKDAEKETKKYNASVLATVAGATAVGAVIGGPVGAAVGALTGAVIAGTTAWISYDKSIEKLAKDKLFGSISVSMEEWNKILVDSVGAIDNFGTKAQELRTSLESHNEAFKGASDSLNLFGYKYGVIGQKISEEDVPTILSAIQTMGDESKNIIEESTNFNVELWASTYAEMSSISEEESKNTLSHIVNYGNQQKSALETAQNNITTTYQNAINARGYLTDEEYKYISEQLAKIRSLTEEEMTKNQANVEYYKSVFASRSLELDEKSYEEYKKAREGYEKEQYDSIEEHYKLLLNSAASYYGKDSKEYKTKIQEANDWRTKKQGEVRDKLSEIDGDIYKNLANTYKEIEGQTDDTSKKQKKIIEGIFKNINVDKKDIVKKFATVGEDAGKSCAEGVGKGFNKGNVKFNFKVNGQSDFTPAGGFQATWNQYANGGLPPVGQVFVANEKGPELIGQIGGQSFVANQNQMMDLLDKKISNSNKSDTLNFYIGSEKIASVVLKDLQDMAKSNGKPIEISA